jgi:carboxyl-terminal processing protease
MNRWTRLLPTLLLLAAVVGFTAGPATDGANGADRLMPVAELAAPQSSITELSEQDRLLRGILTEIWRNYYSEVDITDVAIGGLKGMMAQLDPYSEFYVEEQDTAAVADLENTIIGSYSGIGATIASRGGDLSIVAPMKMSPAANAGLQAGDIINMIDGTPSRHFTASKAASLIKGPVGTEVVLMVLREGFPDPLEIPIIRATIEVNDVSAAEFAAPGIAYVEIGRFTRNTGKFLLEEIQRLQSEQPIEGMILDLRANPGGLLDEALAVAEPFLPDDELVVYTRGRMRNMNAEFRTKEPQHYAGRLASLVNNGSASASEIVAGAFQDLDRGITVGKPTFGKGLIQQVAQLDEGTFLRLTTGEYFTPSGRSLQREFVRDARGMLAVPNPAIPDTTEHPVYTSRSGREVRGGGGVVPDIEADGIMGNGLLFELKFIRTMFLRYVNNYVNTRNIGQGTQVVVDDALLDDFQEWSLEQGFTFQTPTEMQLDHLKRTAEAEEIAESMASEIAALESAIESEKARLWETSRHGIALELRREFVTRLEGYGRGQLVYMEEDPQFQAALRAVQDAEYYAGILAGTVIGSGTGREY